MSVLHRLAGRLAPETEGTVALPGLEATVEVVRDRYGFVHIDASGLDDLLRAQGYVHAQDRLFQMEMLRRFGSGRLAEIAGSRMVELDRFVRRLRLRWAAEREAEALDADTASRLEAYCEGVNAYIAGGRMPLEFRIARLRAAPWTLTDALLVGKVLALSLCGNWEAELVRMRIAARLGEERARQLDPAYLTDSPVIVPSVLAREAMRRVGWLRRLIGLGGSNNWVVAGSRTETGKPICANDPHLHLGLPVIWHVQHLSWDGGTVAGFTIPGTALVILGRNEHVAWGATAAFADTQDLFVEQFDPDDPSRYRVEAAWVEAQVVREEIAVRGGSEPVIEKVVVTRHGPVVAGPEPESGKALALRWSAHEPGETAAAVLELARAASLDEAERALDRYAGPPLNFVLADVHGSIGYRLAGGPMPVRECGNGSVPVPGPDSSHEWRGWVPPAELPRVRDPERGFIVTANNRIVGDGYPHLLGNDQMNGYRAKRIESLLDALDRVTVDDCRRIQLDQVSLAGRELAAVAATFESDDPLERRALELLTGWDGDQGPDSAAGAVYGVLMRRLQEEAYSELGPDLLHFLGAGQSEATSCYGLYERTRPVILELLAARDDSFFTDGRTWDSVFRKALGEAVAELGPDPESWRWGSLHQVVFEHPFGELPVLGRVFRRGPFPAGGDTDTVWQMAWPTDRPYGPRCVGPAVRAVYDLSDPDSNHVVLATGQSGHLGSPHYDDFVERWWKGELVPLVLTRGRIEELAESRLVLVPS